MDLLLLLSQVVDSQGSSATWRHGGAEAPPLGARRSQIGVGGVGEAMLVEVLCPGRSTGWSGVLVVWEVRAASNPQFGLQPGGCWNGQAFCSETSAGCCRATISPSPVGGVGN